jgi:hypothetical protein
MWTNADVRGEREGREKVSGAGTNEAKKRKVISGQEEKS